MTYSLYGKELVLYKELLQTRKEKILVEKWMSDINLKITLYCKWLVIMMSFSLLVKYQ